MRAKFLGLVLLAGAFVFYARPSQAIDSDLGRFCVAKQEQIRALAETITNKVPPVVWRFFDAVRVDDWETATNLAARINAASHRYATPARDDAMAPALATLIWPPISESYGAYEQFHKWNNRWLHRFGKEIISSIPSGSIYFGGTDDGRFIISALCESQVEGRPFFTLTQNQLADQTYLDYLRAMYGRKISVPTLMDGQQAFQQYAQDVAHRRELGQLKPGEDVRVVNGRVQISGQIAVMQINALLVRKIFDENPRRAFFIEESYPLDWMYPHLTPSGLILQLNRQPLPELTVKEVSADQEYWKKLTDEMLGAWLEDKTPLKEVCNFADKYGLGKHLDDYQGDKAFADNADARACFSKLRTAIAGLYAWRADHAHNPDERTRMIQAADLAFRQGYAICPYSPETIFRYVNVLLGHQRADDAVLLVKTSLHLNPDSQQLKELLSQLVAFRKKNQ